MEQKIEKGIGFLQRLIALQNKYGFFSIIKGLFILLLSGYVVFFALNPTYLLDKIENVKTEQHEDAIAKRIKSDTEVRLILERLLNKSEAGRSWLIEFHNGNSNLGSGLPFLFGSMRLETTKDGILGVEEEYADFSLSRYPLLAKVLEDGFFYGSIEDIKPLDQKLYFKMKSNNVTEVALLAIYKGTAPLGIVGLTYCNTPMDAQRVGMLIRKAGVQIATLLS